MIIILEELKVCNYLITKRVIRCYINIDSEAILLTLDILTSQLEAFVTWPRLLAGQNVMNQFQNRSSD